MACINSDNFSASDLLIFIESIEKISNLEKSKRERQQQFQAQQLAKTLRYLDQEYPCSSSSSTLSSTDEPEYEDLNIEEKQIVCHYAVKDIINNWDSEDQGYESISLEMNENLNTNDGYELCYDDLYRIPLSSMESTKISESFPSVSSTGIYEDISGKQLLRESKKKMTLKRRLLDLIRKQFKSIS